MSARPIYVVTGATGFVGGVLGRTLRARGVHVRALVRRVPGHAGEGSAAAVAPAGDARWDEAYACDLATDPIPEAALAGARAVLHLAGVAHAEDSPATDRRHREVTVEGTRRLLAACAAQGVERFVYVSSVKAMGESTGVSAPLDEQSPSQPTTEYGRTKRAAEELVLAGPHAPARGVVLRPPLVYGAGQKGNLARLLAWVARPWFPALPAGPARRSYVHVEDLVQAAVLVAEHDAAAGRVFLVCEPRACSTREIQDAARAALGLRPPAWSVSARTLGAAASGCDAAVRLLGRPLPFGRAALEKLLGPAWYDGSALERTVGFAPRHALLESLGERLDASPRR